ncbi:MAG: hypothetical protein GF375_01930 [Candidatus Omnitrophica bacterium]|nr:hypothetical protein [Candidatus Omnitrophota bacterium]MBD3268885.1 hypothetical protein [Candidatus Omnitrophota bacterium]
MIIVIYVLLIIGFVLFFLGLIPKPAETISVFGDKIKEEKGSSSLFLSILRIFAPLNKGIIKFMRLEGPLNNKINLVKWRVKPEEFLASQELLAVVFPLILFLLFEIEGMPWLVGAAMLGFFLPLHILNSKVKKRKYSIVRVLPETVDLLTLCVGAGLDFMAAVRWVIDKVRVNPLIEELALVLKEINVGKPRIEALRDMARRLDIPDVTSFVRTLVQADRMGTSVEEAFKILSEDTRMKRFHRGERQAMKAPLKMLIPLIFCILPVILIVVAGPVLIKFIRGSLFTGLGGGL